MTRSFMGTVTGTILLTSLALNTVLWCGFLFLVTFLKIVVPLKHWRKLMGKVAIAIANTWILFNSTAIDIARLIKCDVEGIEELDMNEWYLVISNHQSWVDIPLLQKVFYKKIPFLKFFLKKELIWVPILGPAWWALDFPFMKRYTQKFLKKNPHLKGKDMEITRQACEKFKDMPVSIMNYVEGTRFSPEKLRRQNAPFKNLLRPKAGGTGFVLSAMGTQLGKVLNVTIIYPEGALEMWDFLCGRMPRVHVKVETLPITEEILGNYSEDREYRIGFQKWLNDLWIKKDEYIEDFKKAD